MKVLCCPGAAVGMGAVSCAPRAAQSCGIPKQIRTALALGVCTNCCHPVPINHSRRCSLQNNNNNNKNIHFWTKGFLRLAGGFGARETALTAWNSEHLWARGKEKQSKKRQISVLRLPEERGAITPTAFLLLFCKQKPSVHDAEIVSFGSEPLRSVWVALLLCTHTPPPPRSAPTPPMCSRGGNYC